MKAQVSEVIVLTQTARKFNFMFSFLVPHSIMGILAIIISNFIPIPTLTIILTPFFYFIGDVGYPSGPMIVPQAHSSFGWVEMKPRLVPRHIG